MAAEPEGQNPYVGPRPFTTEEADRFFGRNREINDLLHLITAHRLLLVYAASGSGKSSLMNAGLVPRLRREGFEVLPRARVRGLVTGDVEPDNVYVYNVLAGWREDGTPGEELQRLTLAEFLERRPHPIDEAGLEAPRVVIFDQFEELFTFYPERWRDRGRFFTEVDQALKRDPLLRVLFVMREDDVAQLDAYADRLSDGIRTRFRLQRLDHQAALRAVRKPLEGSPRRFADGVAEELIDELLKVRAEGEAGTVVEVEGEFVEPVHLQLVCQSLWEELPPTLLRIDRSHLREFGDPVETLAAFYERSIRKTVEATPAGEGELRRWFGRVLITPVGTRGTVHRGPETTGGLPNEAVERLEDEHLIRGELRAGLRWYELNHDRFIEAIQRSNRKWRAELGHAEETRQRLENQAQQWIAAGQGSAHLLAEVELLEAARWLESPEAEELDKSENLLAFVQASRTAVEAREAARRQELEHAQQQAEAAKRLRRRAIVLGVVSVLTLAIAVYALIQRWEAKRNAERAQALTEWALENEELARIRAREAKEAEARAADLAANLLVASGELEEAKKYRDQAGQARREVIELIEQGEVASALAQEIQRAYKAEARALELVRAYKAKKTLDRALDLYLGRHRIENELAARPLFQRAAAAGDPLAKMWLARSYFTGRLGLPVDRERGQELAREAIAAVEREAAKGDWQAAFLLGSAYAEGLSVEADVSQAIRWYKTACENEFLAGCNNLGLIYGSGDRVEQQPAEAVRLYRISCSAGNAMGCANLGNHYDRGEGVARDLVEAVRLYRMACDAGNALGCSNLGVQYERGEGVAQDAAEAVRLYRMACDGGSDRGCENLGRLRP